MFNKSANKDRYANTFRSQLEVARCVVETKTGIVTRRAVLKGGTSEILIVKTPNGKTRYVAQIHDERIEGNNLHMFPSRLLGLFLYLDRAKADTIISKKDDMIMYRIDLDSL